MDRSLLYEKWLDDVDLYLVKLRELKAKKKAKYDEGFYDLGELFWQEEEQLDHLRELSRRALDEYVSTGRPSDGGQAEAPGA